MINGEDDSKEALFKRLEYMHKVLSDIGDRCGYVKKHKEKIEVEPAFETFEMEMMMMGAKAIFEFSLN